MPESVESRTSLAAQLWLEAESLSNSVFVNSSNDSQEVNFDIRHKLHKVLERLFLIDVDYGISKQAEVTLWNFCYKMVIDNFQAKLRRRKTEGEAAVRLKDTFPYIVEELYSMFLYASMGSLHQFLTSLCDVYDLKVPNFWSSSILGSLSHRFKKNIKNCTNGLYMTQFCLIHLGDICRYQRHSSAAESYYLHATEVDCTNGHPWNQLGILCTSKNQTLAATWFYVRSLNTEKPFSPAAANLEKFYGHLSNEKIDEIEISPENLNLIFLHIHARIHHFCQLSIIDEKLITPFLENLAISLENNSLKSKEYLYMFGMDVATCQKSNTDSQDEIYGGKIIRNLIGRKFDLLMGFLVKKKEEDPECAEFVSWIEAVYITLEWLSENPREFRNEILKEVNFVENKDKIIEILQSLNHKFTEKVTDFSGFLPLSFLTPIDKVPNLGECMVAIFDKVCTSLGDNTPASSSPECSKTSPSIVQVQKIGTASPSPQSSRKTKVVPLLRILGRPLDAEPSYTERKTPESSQSPDIEKSSKNKKGLKVTLPPEEPESSKEEIKQEPKIVPPRFQAQKLKQALTGGNRPSVPYMTEGPSAGHVPFPAFPGAPPPMHMVQMPPRWNPYAVPAARRTPEPHETVRPPPHFPRTPGNRVMMPPPFLPNRPPPPGMYPPGMRYPMNVGPMFRPNTAHMFPPTADPYFNLWREGNESANDSWSSSADESGEQLLQGLEYMPFSTKPPPTEPTQAQASIEAPSGGFKLFTEQPQWFQNWSSQDGSEIKK